MQVKQRSCWAHSVWAISKTQERNRKPPAVPRARQASVSLQASAVSGGPTSMACAAAPVALRQSHRRAVPSSPALSRIAGEAGENCTACTGPCTAHKDQLAALSSTRPTSIACAAAPVALQQSQSCAVPSSPALSRMAGENLIACTSPCTAHKQSQLAFLCSIGATNACAAAPEGLQQLHIRTVPSCPALSRMAGEAGENCTACTRPCKARKGQLAFLCSIGATNACAAAPEGLSAALGACF